MDKIPDFSTILSAFFSWQALVFGLAVVAVFHVVQGLIPEEFRERPYFKKGLLPVLPILLGATCANLFPVHPDVLWSYAEEPTFTAHDRVWIFVAYGLVVGQLSGFLWLAVMSALGKFTQVPDGPSQPPPPPSAPPAP